MLLAVAAVPHVTVRVDGVNVCTRDDFGAVPGRRRGERAADRAHASDRDVPVAGAAAEQVIQEAHVLRQRRVVGAGECADQRVGRHHAAHQIVGHRVRNRLRDGLIDHEPPRGVVADVSARLVARAQRLHQRRPQPRGDDAAATVELGEPRLVARSANRPERRVRSDQQARAAARRRIGRVRRVAAAHQPHPGTQVVDDAAWQQADQI